MRSWKAALVVFIVLALLGGGLFALRGRGRATSEPSGEVRTVERGEFKITAISSGSLVLPIQKTLSFGVAGTVKRVYVEVGNRVEQGRLLAELDTAPLKLALIQAEANLQAALSALNKFKDTYSEEAVKDVEGAVKEARENLEVARQNFEVAKKTWDQKVVQAEEGVASAEQTYQDAQTALDSAKKDLELTKKTWNQKIKAAEEAVAQAQASLELARKNLSAIEKDWEIKIGAAQQALDEARENYKAVVLRYMGLTLEDEEVYQDLKEKLGWASLPAPVETAWRALLDTRDSLELLQLQQEKALYSAREAVREAEEGVNSARDSLALLKLQADQALTKAERAVQKAEDDLKQARKRVDEARDTLELTRLQRENALRSARLAIIKAERVLKKAEEELKELKAGPDPEELRAKELQVEAARENLKQAKEDLEKARLVTPFTGTVAEVRIDEGTKVSATTPAIIIVDLSRWQVEAFFDELDIARIRPGQEVEIEVEALPSTTEHPLLGKVDTIYPLAIKQAGVVNYKVIIDVEGTRGGPPGADLMSRLREGMSATVSAILFKMEDVIMVPNRAIVSKGKATYVKVVREDGTVEEREVSIGPRNDEWTVVRSGLRGGEKILVERKAARSERFRPRMPIPIRR